MEKRLGDWLARQCELVSGASQGIITVSDPAGAPPKLLAVWPAGSSPTVELLEAAAMAASSGRPVIHAGPREAAPAVDHLALPLTLTTSDRDGARRSAVAITLPQGTQVERTRTLRLIQIGAAWLPMVTTATPSTSGVEAEAQATLELIGLCLRDDAPRAAASALATQLAVALGCERVALGVVEGRRVRIRALSHSARFDERSALVRDTAAAMEEAIDQEASLLHPPASERALELTRAHAALCASHDASTACTVPFTHHDRVAGAMTLVWHGDGAPSRRDVAWVDRVAALVGPLLVTRLADERPIARRLLELARARLTRHFGRDKPGVRLVVAALAFAVVALALIPGTHRVSSPARLEGSVQRALVASIDGYIAEAGARAGDVVVEGQVLAQLDSADLTLQQKKWAGRHAQLTREYRAALSIHDRAEASVLRARLDETEAEIGLLEEQLARTWLVSPFNGVITRGDLSRRLGSPVERGEVLFELAPRDDYRIVLEVDEREIGRVDVGQRGELTLNALPGEKLELTVERIIPVALAEEGRNFFPVEAQLASPSERLRPGMEGVGKIEVGRRSLLWLWTHRLADFIRLALWSWTP